MNKKFQVTPWLSSRQSLFTEQRPWKFKSVLNLLVFTRHVLSWVEAYHVLRGFWLNTYRVTVLFCGSKRGHGVLNTSFAIQMCCICITKAIISQLTPIMHIHNNFPLMYTGNLKSSKTSLCPLEGKLPLLSWNRKRKFWIFVLVQLSSYSGCNITWELHNYKRSVYWWQMWHSSHPWREIPKLTFQVKNN